MIKIYNVERELISTTNKYNNMEIQREINQIDKLRFYTDKETGGKIKLEGYIEINEGVFVVKENALSVNYSILAHMDLEEFDEIILELKLERMTLNEMIAELAEGTGWTIVGDSDERKTITIDGLSIIDAIFRCVNLFSYEIRFNNIKKEITIGETIGEDRGIYFHSDLNLRSLNMSSDTYDYATRLIPKGKEGLGIESVNDGVPYVENYTFSNKIITKVWRDERYTIAENLKAAAEARLAEIAKPTSYLECSVADLSSHSDYDFFSYDVGDYIFLIDRDLNIKEKYKIGSIRLFPKSIEDSLVVIENKQRSVNDTIRSQDEKIEEHSEDLSNYDDRLSKIEDILGISPDGDWGDWDDDDWTPGVLPEYERAEDLIKSNPGLSIGLSSWVDVNEVDAVSFDGSGRVINLKDAINNNIIYEQRDMRYRPSIKNMNGRRWVSFNPDPRTMLRWNYGEDRPEDAIQQHGQFLNHLNKDETVRTIYIVYYDRTPDVVSRDFTSSPPAEICQNNRKIRRASNSFPRGYSSPLGYPYSYTVIPSAGSTSIGTASDGRLTPFYNSRRITDEVVLGRPSKYKNVLSFGVTNFNNLGMNKKDYDGWIADRDVSVLTYSNSWISYVYEMNAFFTGEITEIIVYNRELDSREHEIITNYLESKYGFYNILR